MFKNLTIIVLGLLMIGLMGCNIKTPEIKGVVFDAETKQPVEGVWVRATLEIKTKTVGGDVHTVLSVDPPHTRTDKQGRFAIPSRGFKKPVFPAGFGTEVESFDINAKTVDKSGGIEVNINDLKKKKIEVAIYIRSIEKIYEEQYQKYMKEGIKKERALELIEGDYFSSLQSLCNYCLTGRSSVEIPPVEGGCDTWELDYAIIKHERYLEKYKGPKIIEQPAYGVSKFENIIHYSSIQQQLGDLLKKRGYYEKALNIFKQVKEFDEKHGLSFHLKEYDIKINELKQLLQQKHK